MPPLVIHAPVRGSDDADAVREAVRHHLGPYLRTISCPAMLASAGYPEALEGR